MKSRTFKDTRLILAILSLILVISFYDVVFLGKTFKVTTANPQALQSGPYGQEHNRPSYFPVISTDTSILEEPVYEYIKQCFRKGIIPLWNPHQACGYPLIAMMEMGMFFPVNFFLYIFPQAYAWDMMIFCRFLLAGLFTYWLMRSFRYGKIPSLGAAIIFMLSGPMVLLQYLFTNVEILTPLLLISLEFLAKRPSPRTCCITALACAATFFAGHPEHVMFVNAFGFFFFFFRIFSMRPRANIRQSIIYLSAAYLLAVGLSAVVLFPFLRNFATEFWNNHPPTIGLRADGIPSRIITLVIPFFFQKEPVARDFTPAGWWGGYIGVLTCGLAFLSLLSRQRQKLNYFFAVIAFLNISKSYFGAPFINWIGYLPILHFCRFYVHTSHLFALCMAILAGMGIRVLLARRRLFRKGLLFSLPLAAVVIFFLFYFRKSGHFGLSLRESVFCLMILVIFQAILFLKDKKYLKNKSISWLVLFVISLELFSYVNRGRVNRLDSFPKVPYIEFLKNQPEKIRSYGTFWTFYPNTATGYAVDDFGIAFGLLPKRFVNFVNHLIFENYFKQDMRHSAFWVFPVTFNAKPKPYFDLLNVGYTVAPKTVETLYPPVLSPGFPKPIYSDEVKIYRRLNAFPRAFVVHRAVFEPDEETVFAKIKQISKNLKNIVVIHHAPVLEINRQLAEAPVADGSQVKILHYRPNEVILEADLENPGFVILSDSYHPDWKAFVDGQPSQIFIADYLIRAVFLTAGRHTVRFSFEPLSFYLGELISFMAAALAAAILWRRSARAKNTKA